MGSAVCSINALCAAGLLQLVGWALPTIDGQSRFWWAVPTLRSTLLQVMEQKGLVDHRRQGKAYVYLPTVDRGKTLRDLAGGFLERVFDGTLDEYLVHALGTRKVSKRELDQLEEMLATARSKKK